MRRFGRNQKRKMREQIENALTAETMSRELARHYSDKLRSARDEIEDAKRIIGEHSVLFAPSERSVGKRFPRYDVAMMQDISMYSIGDDLLNLKRISLPVMLLEVKNKDREAFNRLGNKIHIALHFADDSLGYACDAQAIRHIGVNRIAQEMARLLHDKLSRAHETSRKG